MAPGDRWLASGLTAAAAAMLAQSAFDWLWLIPGVTGLGVFALALAAGLGVPPADRPPRPPLRIAAGVAAAAVAVSAFVLLIGDFYVRDARAALDRSPDSALEAARTAESLNPWSVTPLYLQASALESRGRPAEARRALLDARELEPRNWATLGLLGDLESRAGNRRAARTWYRRALALNPRDVGLRDLAGAGPR